MIENPTGESGLPWPEDYRDLLPAIRKEWGVKGDIYLVRQLSAGKSGALVYTADITTERFAGQAILKLDRSIQSIWNESNEAERHRRAVEAAPDFAAEHLPQLLHSLHKDEQIASLSTIAAGGLEYVSAWFDCPHERQLSVARQASGEMLGGWNRNYRIADGMQTPETLLRKWLGYRIDRDEGRIFRFVTEKCGLSPEEPSFVFEGHWHPNPLAFALGTYPVPDHLRLRAAIGNQHGDLHGHNLLVGGGAGVEPHYYLIDLAMYEADQFLFFDHAYLELSYLLRAREDAGWSRWDAILQCLGQPPGARDMSALQGDDLGLVGTAAVIREGVPDWIARHESHRVANMDSQVRLARVGAGLSWTNKLMPDIPRQMAFIYAASNLRDYLAFHGVDWPRHGPPLMLTDGAGGSTSAPAPRPVPPVTPAKAPDPETVPSPETAAPAAPGVRWQRRVLAVVGVIVIAVAAAIWVWKNWKPAADTSQTVAAQSATDPATQKPPSIVVLPFDNLSAGDENDMLATGVTSTLTAALAQVPELEVISRRSAQHYKGRDLTTRQIAKELGVRYVLDGSLQRMGDRVRITTELVDGATGRVVWSEKYRRKAENLLAVEDEIALKVMVLLQVKLTEGEQAAVRGEQTQNLEAYLLFVRAQREYRTYTKRGMTEVRRLTRKIHALDPNYAPAYLLEAASHAVDARLGYADAAKSLDAAYQIFKKMASLDGHLSVQEQAVILAAEATIDQNAGTFDTAIATGEKALALAPNNVEVLSAFGMILYFAGDFDRSIDMFRRAMRLQPAYPSWYTIYLARSYVFKGDTDEAIKLAEDGKKRAESDFLRAISATNLVFAYYEAGRTEEARREAAEIKRFMPSLSVESLLKHQRYRNERDKAKLIEALKQSGLA